MHNRCVCIVIWITAHSTCLAGRSSGDLLCLLVNPSDCLLTIFWGIFLANLLSHRMLVRPHCRWRSCAHLLPLHARWYTLSTFHLPFLGVPGFGNSNFESLWHCSDISAASHLLSSSDRLIWPSYLAFRYPLARHSLASFSPVSFWHPFSTPTCHSASWRV